MELRWNRDGIERILASPCPCPLVLAVSCIKLGMEMGMEMSKDGGCALSVSSLVPFVATVVRNPIEGLTGSGAFQGEIC